MAKRGNGILEEAKPKQASLRLQPEALKPVKEVRANLHRTFGQIVLALASVPHYRSLSVADLAAFILDPLLHDRLMVARAKEPVDPAMDDGFVGFAVWASVSEAVDAKIKAQIKANTYPVHLGRDDWRSGNKTWLLDVVARSDDAARGILMQLSKATKSTEMSVHPALNKLVKSLDASQRDGRKL